MRKYKKQLAAALAVTMVLNQGLSAAAARRNAGEFVRTEDGWQYIVGGEPVYDEFVTETDANGKTKTYYLNDLGILESNGYISAGGIEDGQRYALPDGSIAINQFVNMNPESVDPRDAVWHYFEENGYEVASDNTELAKRKKINENYYAFNDAGDMITNDWYDAPLSEKAENPVEQRYYAQFFGENPTQKWLYLDGKWQYFDIRGLVTDTAEVTTEDVAKTKLKAKPNLRYAAARGAKILTEDHTDGTPDTPDTEEPNKPGTGTPDIPDTEEPNKPGTGTPDTPDTEEPEKPVDPGTKPEVNLAPCQTILDIDPITTSEVKAEKGKEVELAFNVKLNEKEKAKETGKLTDSHDFYYYLESEDYTAADNFAVKADPDKNGTTYTLKYTPSGVGSMKFTAVIDGVESEPVTVTVPEKEITKDEANKEVNNAISGSGVEDILKNDNVKEGVLALQNAFLVVNKDKKSGEDSQKILKAWKDNFKNLMELERKYALQADVETESNFDTEAAKLLGLDKGDVSKAVKIAGLALNSRNGESATFSMNYVPGQDKPVITEKHPGNKQVTFDMGVLIGDREQPDIPLVIEMPLPAGFSGNDFTIYQFHYDETTGKTEMFELDVTVNKKEKTITFAVDRFSEFTFVGEEEDTTNNNNENSSNRYYGSHRSSRTTTVNVQNGQNGKPAPTPGQWNQLADGKWQFVNNGTPYTNTWIYVNERWYWIDAAGMMAEGWQNVNGKMYFMVYGSGYMWTGWMTDSIDWFYFDETGALVTNGTTADGYQVDARGAWIH